MTEWINKIAGCNWCNSSNLQLKLITLKCDWQINYPTQLHLVGHFRILCHDVRKHEYHVRLWFFRSTTESTLIRHLRRITLLYVDFSVNFFWSVAYYVRSK
jgi:hypothetical protein